MNYEITVQIFSGSFLEETASWKQIEKKLEFALSRLAVNKVIMGWSPDPYLYEKTASYLVKRNIDFYLWFPVFSENSALMKLGPLIDYKGEHTRSRGEHWDEDFIFCCPNNEQNTEKILDKFKQQYSSIPFTGIFLDRIRYSSFANGQGFGYGFRNVFACFCPYCLEYYEKENFNVDQLKEAISFQTSPPLGITGYSGNGNYTFEDSIISDFFRLKAGIIYRSLSRICRFFKEKGLGVGFDVFAPFLSPFVGQDLVSLSGLCDFIKPMMYRATSAPAGIPFELEALLRETSANTINRKNYYDLMNINPARKPFDLVFSVNELQNLSASSACPVHAGIEINRKKNLADAHPDYIEETIKVFADTGIRGFALSWNLLDTPEENITSAAEAIKNVIS
ncbi:MAG: hypothetical protein FWG29_01170 [Treponema sp.]|nr:hypothetical protein [Treponema sp.]